MKKLFILAAASGLASLAACTTPVTNNTAAAMANEYEAKADNLEAAADNAVMGSNTEAALENQANDADEKADNLSDAAHQ